MAIDQSPSNLLDTPPLQKSQGMCVPQPREAQKGISAKVNDLGAPLGQRLSRASLLDAVEPGFG